MRIDAYLDDRERNPFDDWYESLDARKQRAVDRRLRALAEHDHFSDYKSLKGGLWELRLKGPGLRIYYSKTGQDAILLLGGSGKGGQRRAIAKARERLADYKARTT